MGNNIDKNSSISQYDNYELISKNVHEGLGEFSVCKDHATNQFFLVFMSTYTIANPDLAETELLQMKRLNELRHACRLINHEISKSKMLCMENYSMHLVFEYYNLNLDTLNNQKNNERIAEPEIWLIISDIVTYLSELFNLGLVHGDLQPTNILLNNNRVVKILSPLLYTSFQTAYDYRLANDTYKSTYSPELLQHFENRVQNPKVDAKRSDIYSLGICLLCLVANEQFPYFYDFVKNIVYVDRVKIKLADMVKAGYSDRLFFFVNQCLKENVYERATLDSLVKLVGANKNMSSSGFWKNTY